MRCSRATTGGAPREAFARGWRHPRTLLTATFHDLSTDAADADDGTFSFYPMPWGADERVFTPPRAHDASGRAQNDTARGAEGHLLAIGTDPFGESHGELLFAAAHAGRQMRHVGSLGDNVCGDCRGADVSDETAPLNCQPLAALGGRAPCDWHTSLGRVSEQQLVREMQAAAFVGSLRKEEGFEIAGIEALFCGARPIVFNMSTYRWYEGHGIFVPPELPSDQMFHTLVAALRQPARPVTRPELLELHRKFSWRVLVPSFYERIRAELSARRGDDPWHW